MSSSRGIRRFGLGLSRSSRRNSWLSYESSRRLQRDAVTGLVMVFLAALVLLAIGAFGGSFSVQSEDGRPVSDGKECEVLVVSSADDPSAPARQMIDCGNESDLGFSGFLQYAAVAVGAVGTLLLLSAVFSLVLAARMPRETLAVPFCVAAIVLGVISILWGLGDTGGPAIVFQGDRTGAVTGVLRAGGQFTTRDGAIAAGVGLIAGSIVRLTRP